MVNKVTYVQVLVGVIAPIVPPNLRPSSGLKELLIRWRSGVWQPKATNHGDICKITTKRIPVQDHPYNQSKANK